MKTKSDLLQRFGEPLEVGNKANNVRYKKVRGTFGGWK